MFTVLSQKCWVVAAMLSQFSVMCFSYVSLAESWILWNLSTNVGCLFSMLQTRAKPLVESLASETKKIFHMHVVVTGTCTYSECTLCIKYICKRKTLEGLFVIPASTILNWLKLEGNIYWSKCGIYVMTTFHVDCSICTCLEFQRACMV